MRFQKLLKAVATLLIMMDGSKYFVDTNIIIDLFRGKSEVVDFIKENTDFSVSVIVLGELVFGAENSSQFEKHVAQINSFIDNCSSIVNVDLETSIIYGKIKSELKKSGKPIPENDIWIAALAIQYDRFLVTNDAHFNYIKQLTTKKIENA